MIKIIKEDGTKEDISITNLLKNKIGKVDLYLSNIKVFIDEVFPNEPDRTLIIWFNENSFGSWTYKINDENSVNDASFILLKVLEYKGEK